MPKMGVDWRTGSYAEQPISVIMRTIKEVSTITNSANFRCKRCTPGSKAQNSKAVFAASSGTAFRAKDEIAIAPNARVIPTAHPPNADVRLSRTVFATVLPCAVANFTLHSHLRPRTRRTARRGMTARTGKWISVLFNVLRELL